MERIVERPCALDVHKASVTACVRVWEGRELTEHIAEFKTTVQELLALRDWLEALAVSQVVMEATGVYWRPVWAVLEDQFELMLVNARHVKQCPGRKTDVLDAQWLCQLLEAGLLKASFVPPKPIRTLRNLTKSRTDCVSCADRGRRRWSSSTRRIRLSAARLRWRGSGRWAESPVCSCVCLMDPLQRSR
ncbi:MAG: IS110 family transposase [Solirubrobacteraceae bacterium]